MDQATVLRLRQDAALTADLDLDAIARAHADDDAVLTLVDLAREIRDLGRTVRV